jgi:hypothetical protein
MKAVGSCGRPIEPQWLCLLSLVGLLVELSVGCSGSSALDGSKKLVDLTHAEWNELCQSAPRAMNTPSCPNGSSDDVNDPTVCMNEFGTLRPDCVATVAMSEECEKTLAGDPCHAADEGLSSPACLVTQACLGTLCSPKCQLCADPSGCTSTCAPFETGLTKECAACIMTGFGSPLMCPDFTQLPADHCGSACAGSV